MHRLLVESAQLQGESVTLDKSAANHLRVVRPKNGEEIELFDGKGRSRIYRFDCARANLSACGELLDRSSAAKKRREIWLFACVTKGSRWDWTIEKATELGAAKIIPVISDRTIVRIPASERAAKRSRWLRIAQDAARQSSALFIPEILEALDFEGALKLVRQTECFVGALTSEPSEPLLSALSKIPESGERPIAVFIGPEGDFTREELAALLRLSHPTSFGELILRAETAAIFALSTVAAMLDKNDFKEISK